MSVFRETELPSRRARRRLVVPEAVAEATKSELQKFRGADGDHEGLIYWAGREVGNLTCVLCAIVPRCIHEPYRVLADELAIADAARSARGMGLGLIAQVHSHPGEDTRHSDGDDVLVLMPFEGMFSLVIARYGRGGMTPSEGAGLHEFQDGVWVSVSDDANSMVVVPSVLMES